MDNNYRLYNSIMESITNDLRFALNDGTHYDAFEYDEYGLINVRSIILCESGDSHFDLFSRTRNLLRGVIKYMRSNNKKAETIKIIKKCNHDIKEWLKVKKTITAPRYFYIVVLAITLYGGNDIINKIKPIIQDIEDTFNFDDKQFKDIEKSDKDIDFDEIQNNLVTPAEYFKHSKDTYDSFHATPKAISFIQKKEMLSLYPYYATEREKSLGMITIGYGHVITGNEDPALLRKIDQLKKSGMITCFWIKNPKTNKYMINPVHAPEIIRNSDAQHLFL